MNAAKIRLSPKEQELVFNPDWILTKNRILDKVKELFASVQQEYSGILTRFPSLPQEVLCCSYKISRGENYLGLPWVVLDYPRCFEKTNTFAIRTMFWWGNFFSLTLQLSGRYKKELEATIIASEIQLAADGYFICVEEDPWQHHFEPGNYRQVKKLLPGEFNNLIRSKPFLKLATKFSLEQWDESSVLLGEKFRQVLSVVSS